MHGHDCHNTTVLSIIHNMSTTCFDQYYFWPSSGWIQFAKKTIQYITISVGVSRGGRVSFTKDREGVCAEGLICRSIYVMLRL
jgi:hypothetical protein